ncbi:MAG: hypothetical protein IKQ22_03910 [Clostridia bacterium]|nr:hypothetical protein [Clostridia bacterium]
MAKLRMTYKNLKALRKSKEYQALLVDLVSVGVVPKATAEGLLGYNIPANLIIDDENSGTDNPITDGGESGGEGSGTEGSGEQGSANKVTLVHLDAAANDNAGEWETAEYDLTDDPTGTGIIAFAQDAFDNDTLNAVAAAELNPEYTEGESDVASKYIPLNPQPKGLQAGMIIVIGSTAAVGQ